MLKPRIFPFLVLSPALATGAVVVNAPLPITHRVQVQPIITQSVLGAPAVFLGSADEEAYIKDQVNAIWAQAGVRIDWLEPAAHPSAFAYDGWPANYTMTTTRPPGDLTAIINGAGVPPKSANAVVLNAFFVEVAPGFSRSGIYTTNGYARIDANGMALHIGDALPTFTGGRDVIAGVIAHEIGHNLGLDHTANGGDNLMSPNGSSDRLSASQRVLVFTDHAGIDGYDFLQPVAVETHYSRWASAAKLRGGPGDDDDGDGVPNVVEFMLGLQGNRADALPLPVAGVNGVTWRLPKLAGALADGLVYAVQSSADGLRWVAAGNPGSGSTILADDADALVVGSPGVGAGVLLRLAVAIPAGLAGEAATFIPQELADVLNAGRVIREVACGCEGCESVP